MSFIIQNALYCLLCVFVTCNKEKSNGCLKIKAVTTPIHHAEGPHWDHKSDILYYVDTFHATLYRWDPKNNQITSQKIDERNSIAVTIPIKSEKNEFLVAADRFLYKLYWDGKGNNTGKLTELKMFEPDKPNNQFNDGKCDEKGNFWIGSLTRNKDLSVENNGGNLYYVKPNLNYEKKIISTSISNGMAWTSNNKYFLWIDSQKKNIMKYNFDLHTGKIDNPTVIYNLSQDFNIPGLPDGMTIDKHDTLWIALLGGGGVLNVDAHSGKFIRRIDLPVTYVTSAAWGGPNLDVLYVTTSRKNLNETQLLKEPFAGCVFEIRGLGTKGLPANEFILYK